MTIGGARFRRVHHAELHLSRRLVMVLSNLAPSERVLNHCECLCFDHPTPRRLHRSGYFLSHGKAAMLHPGVTSAGRPYPGTCERTGSIGAGSYRVDLLDGDGWAAPTELRHEVVCWACELGGILPRPEFNAGKSLFDPPPIDVFPMSDLDDEDNQLFVLDRVDDPVVAFSDPVEVL